MPAYFTDEVEGVPATIGAVESLDPTRMRDHTRYRPEHGLDGPQGEEANAATVEQAILLVLEAPGHHRQPDATVGDVGDRRHYAAAICKNHSDLPQNRERVTQMTEHIAENHHVEARALEGLSQLDGLHVCDDQPVEVGSCRLGRFAIEIYSGNGASPLPEDCGQATLRSANVEHPLGGTHQLDH